MRRRTLISLIVLAIAALVGSQSVFIVGETEQVIVVRFGDPQGEVKDPGLHFKVPFVDDVIYYDDRVLAVDPDPEQLILADQRRLIVDVFVRYRITNPLEFFQAVRSETNARARIATITVSALRASMGNRTQRQVLSEERADIMDEIKFQVAAQSARLGVGIIDVRIVRADVPPATMTSVFERMRSEREREAAQFRAEGEQASLEIRSDADRQREIILADARRDAQIIRGEGDEEAIRIQAEAFSRDPVFFAFYRSMQAYRTALGGGGTTLVLRPDSDFFEFFRSYTNTGVLEAIDAPQGPGTPDGGSEAVEGEAAPADETEDPPAAE